MLKKFNIADWYDLKGQVAIVTGGATGLGLAITRCLISAGCALEKPVYIFPGEAGYIYM